MSVKQRLSELYNDAGHFFLRWQSVQQVKFFLVVPAPAAASLYGQRWFRLSGSEALCCKTMHMTRAMRVLTGHRKLCSLGRMAGCSKMQWAVIRTWAGCSSLNGLQYYARTSAHRSTCGQSDSLVSGIRSQVKGRPCCLSFRRFEVYRCVRGVFVADSWNCNTCGVIATCERRLSLPQKQRFNQRQHAGSMIAGMSVDSCVCDVPDR